MVEFRGDQALMGMTTYAILLMVHNPESASSKQKWTLETFATLGEAALITAGSALDQGEIFGKQIHNVAHEFMVNKGLGSDKGLDKLNQVTVHFALPDPLEDDDYVMVCGPADFNLQFQAGTGLAATLNRCDNFEYLELQNPLPNSGGQRSCKCMDLPESRGFFCCVQLGVDEGTSPALEAMTEIKFQVATRNPRQTPLEYQNYWTIHHYRDCEGAELAGRIDLWEFCDIKSMDATRSWTINPQLDDIHFDLIGPHYRAGAESNIQLTFTTVQPASSLEVTAVQPPGFDFSNAGVVRMGQGGASRNPKTMISKLYVDNLNLAASSVCQLTISRVRLGSPGGHTTWDLKTFKDSNHLVAMDEKTNVVGFTAPGAVDVTKQELNSAKDVSNDPVRQDLPARIGETARVEMSFVVTQNVNANDQAHHPQRAGAGQPAQLALHSEDGGALSLGRAGRRPGGLGRAGRAADRREHVAARAGDHAHAVRAAHRRRAEGEAAVFHHVRDHARSGQAPLAPRDHARHGIPRQHQRRHHPRRAAGIFR